MTSSATGGGGAGANWSTGDEGASARDGGKAIAQATARNVGGGSTTVTATAKGGGGGSAGGLYDGTLVSGNGGEAIAFAAVESRGGGQVVVSVNQIGGPGGGGLSGADGGNGAASYLHNAVSVIADGNLTVVQNAEGGGAVGFPHIPTDHDVHAGDGGAATSDLNFDYEHDLDVTVSAAGAAGGVGSPLNFDSPYRILAGHGGSAQAHLVANAGGILRTQTTALGGDSYGFDPSQSDSQGGAAHALQVVQSSNLDATAAHLARGLAVGGRLGGNAQSSSDASIAAGTLEVKDVAFAYRGTPYLSLVSSHAEGVSSGDGRVTADAQALLGDGYFSSEGLAEFEKPVELTAV